MYCHNNFHKFAFKGDWPNLERLKKNGHMDKYNLLCAFVQSHTHTVTLLFSVIMQEKVSVKFIAKLTFSIPRINLSAFL